MKKFWSKLLLTIGSVALVSTGWPVVPSAATRTLAGTWNETGELCI